MEIILRAITVYVFVLLLVRASGKRTLGQVTVFDFVLLLIIAEATEQALLGDDFSLTAAFLVIGTFFGVDIGLSLVKQRFPVLARALDGEAIIIIRDGEILRGRLDRNRVDLSDILEEARKKHGLERLDQIKYAVLERDGDISIIPQG